MAKRHKNPSGLRNAFDGESYLLDFFRDFIEPECTLLLPEDDATEGALKAMLDADGWADLTAKGEGAPDFASEANKLMVEVMRVDDHEQRPGFNPLRRYEGEILIDEDGGLHTLMATCGLKAGLLLNVTTDLSSEEDHSYCFYLESFRRIVGKHAAKAQGYRESNPDKRLIFFVFDESTAYLACSDEGATRRAGEEVIGQPPWFFLDSEFLKVIRKCGADYFVWFTPFKHAWLSDGSHVDAPTVCVFDCARFDVDAIEYDSARVVSSEE